MPRPAVAEPLDISESPELRELVETVSRERRPRTLRVADQDVAVIVPLASKASRSRKAMSQRDIEAFLSSAGSWHGLVDTDQLKADIAESRRISSRPPLDL